MRKIIAALISFSMSMGLLLFYIALPAAAQTADAQTADAQKAQSTLTATPSAFLSRLADLAVKNHALYVLEGEPVEPGAAAQPLAEWLESSVNELAKHFDYHVEVSPSGIVLFHKTYYAEHDLPSVTLAECLAALKEAARLANTVDPHVEPPVKGHSTLTDGILAAFGPEQLAAMQRGQAEIGARMRGNALSSPRNGLPVSSLSPNQKALAWSAARYLYLTESLKGWRSAVLQSQGIATEKPIFLFHDVNGLHLFGYEMKGKFFPLSNPYQLPPQFDDALPVWEVGTGVSTPPNFDPTQPVEKSATTALPGSVVTTLQSVVEQINARHGAGETKLVSVEDALGAKRVTIVGDLQSVSPLEIARALGAIYGLRVVNSEREIRLTFARERTLNSPGLLKDAMKEHFPLPLEVAYAQKTRRGDPALVKYTFPSGMRVEEVPRYLALKWAAVRRLRQTVEAKIKAAPNKQVSYDVLDEKEKEAFTVAVMSPLLKTIGDFVQNPIPSYITDFDHAILIGGLSTSRTGSKWLSVFMGSRLPSGVLVQESGFSCRVEVP